MEEEKEVQVGGCVYVYLCEVGECRPGTELCQINEWQWVNIGGIRREKWIK